MNPVHVHLALNHVPVLGTMFGLGLLAFAIVWKRQELTRVSLGAFVLIAILAVPVYLTGEPSEDAVNNLPGVVETIIERHEDAASIAFGGLVALGATSLLILLICRGERAIPRWTRLSALALAIAVTVSMIWTANLGGQIRHTEIRSSFQPSSSHGEYEQH